MNTHKIRACFLKPGDKVVVRKAMEVITMKPIDLPASNVRMVSVNCGGELPEVFDWDDKVEVVND